ncbi:MAG: hypothetical protein GXP34_14630 [Actinobacteria bacterium]|nr:hypothetical protein [Actinomycetota bacterium]
MRPNRAIAPILIVFGLGIVLFLALLAGPVLAAESPHTIVVTVTERAPQPDSLIHVQVKVLDEANQPMDVDRPDELLEVRDESGASFPFRPFMERTDVGVYETTLSFPRAGIWTIIAGPDEADVVRLPRRVEISVRGDVAGPLDPGSTVATAALVLFGVLIVVLFGSRLRRSKGSRKASPEPGAHDTWWW